MEIRGIQKQSGLTPRACFQTLFASLMSVEIPLASPSFLMSPRTQGGIRGLGDFEQILPPPLSFSPKRGEE